MEKVHDLTSSPEPDSPSEALKSQEKKSKVDSPSKGRKKSPEKSSGANFSSKAKINSPKKSPEKMIGHSNRIPVILQKKATGTNSRTMICQVDDPKLSFLGDSGAVGRLTVGEKRLKIDLKGRQYDGTIHPGPTVMLLNFAPAVGKEKAKDGSGDIARVEMMTDEYVHLNFTRDVLSGLMGDYHGEGLSDDKSEDGSADGSDDGRTTSRGKRKGGVVISQVTNKKRKSSSKGGKKKK